MISIGFFWVRVQEGKKTYIRGEINTTRISAISFYYLVTLLLLGVAVVDEIDVRFV